MCCDDWPAFEYHLTREQVPVELDIDGSTAFWLRGYTQVWSRRHPAGRLPAFAAVRVLDAVIPPFLCESVAMTNSILFGMFGMPGHLELLIIAGLALLLFGHRLPSLMRSAGRSVVEFKKGVQGIEDDIESAGKDKVDD